MSLWKYADKWGAPPEADAVKGSAEPPPATEMVCGAGITPPI